MPDPAASLHDAVAVVRAGLAEGFARRTKTVVAFVGTAENGFAVAEDNAGEVYGRMGMA